MTTKMDGLKPGDKVAVYEGLAEHLAVPRRLGVVKRVLKTRIDLTDGSKYRITNRGLCNYIKITSDVVEYNAAKHFLEAKKEEQERQAAAEKARRADPKFPLYSRLKNGDFEPFENLSLEQLQTIAAWLEAVK